MKKVLLVVVVLFFIAHQCDTGGFNSSDSHEEKYCKHCNKDLTNDVNRVYSNEGYYCTPCWRATQREIQQELKYQDY